MSSTGTAKRVENDFYPTPAWCIDLISERINWGKVGSVMEPCRGTGAILDAVPQDMATEWAEITQGRDYLTMDLPKVDLAWTNPPFNLAEEFLRRSLEQAKTTIYLLRINFLGSAKRRAFHQAHPPTHLYVLSERPSFVDICKGGMVRTTGAGGIVLSQEKKKGCGAAYQKVDKVKACLECGGTVGAGTDSIEYAWFCYDGAGIMADKPGIYVL
jgi:hypothetical protein